MTKELTQSEMSRKGGRACLKKHGKEFYQKMSKLRWAKSRPQKRAKQK